MIYYIDVDTLRIGLSINYSKLVSIIDKDILDDFINNFADTNNDKFINIKYINEFRSHYKREFEIIMKTAKQKYI